MVSALDSVSTERQAEFVQEIVDAILSGSAWPAFEQELDLEAGYRLQHLITSGVSGQGVGGVKAGVTARPIQKLLGLDHALIASLYGSRQEVAGATIPFLETRIIECEVAIKIGDNGKPHAIAPAIEFVRLCFARQADMNAANLVASNLGTERFIVGGFLPWSDEFEVLTVTLARDGQTIAQTDTAQALGGPAEAAPWLKSEAKKRGFSTDTQTMFLVGACGETPPAEPGEYLAKFGALGELNFSIA